jgi:hypothetical protein
MVDLAGLEVWFKTGSQHLYIALAGNLARTAPMSG